MALTHALSTNNYGVARLIVATTAANGTHTTLTGAMADAASGDTIILRDSVAENVTLTAGVNIAAWTGGTLNTPTITGKLTMTTAGTCNISGIRLTTNSDNIIVVSGSAASIINLNNCYLNCSNNTGISMSSSSSSAQVNCFYCRGDLGTTGIAYYSSSSAGSINMLYCQFMNSGASTTASSNSAGTVNLQWSSFVSPISTSSTGVLGILHCEINTAAQNATCITTAGTGSANSRHNTLSSGTATTISVGSGTTLGTKFDLINSSNTNALDGLGTIAVSDVGFINSTKNNVTTITGGCAQGVNVANVPATWPSSGWIGEQISSTGASVATTTATSKTICSITLSAGVWDISGISASTPTGGAAVMSAVAGGISTTDNTLTGTLGQDYWQQGVAGSTLMSTSVPNVRKTITGSTIYYYVVNNTYTSSTCPTNARISATRVG
jgi:hypothetical protein